MRRDLGAIRLLERDSEYAISCRMEVRYWVSSRGVSPVEDYVVARVAAGDRVLLATFERAVDMLEQHGPSLGMPHARLIDPRDRMYELRLGAHRIAYVVREGEIVLLHAWRKRSRKLDDREAEQARRRLRSQ